MKNISSANFCLDLSIFFKSKQTLIIKTFILKRYITVNIIKFSTKTRNFYSSIFFGCLMGAGAVTGHSQFRGSRVFPSPAPAGNSATTSSDTSFTRTAPKEKSDLQGQPGVKATMSNKPLSCETCDVVFNLFKRRVSWNTC